MISSWHSPKRRRPQLETGRQREWLEVLDPEAANLAAAIDYSVRTKPSLALRFCPALRGWWRARGRFAEAVLAHSRSIEGSGDIEPALRARANESRADIALWMGDYEAAEAHATEALALAEEVGDQGTAARARRNLGNAMAFADPRAARGELARAAELAREAGDDWALVAARAGDGPRPPVPGRTRAGCSRRRGSGGAHRAAGRPAPGRPALGVESRGGTVRRSLRRGARRGRAAASGGGGHRGAGLRGNRGRFRGACGCLAGRA